MKEMVAQTSAVTRKNPGLALFIGAIRKNPGLAFLIGAMMIMAIMGMDASAGTTAPSDPFAAANTALTAICGKLHDTWVRVLVICVVLAGAIMHIAQNRKGLGVAITGLVGLLIVIGGPGLVKLVDPSVTAC